MQTLTIEIPNRQALRLIKELEALNIIKIVKRHIAPTAKKGLAARLAGSATPEEIATMRRELEEMKNEWVRDI